MKHTLRRIAKVLGRCPEAHPWINSSPLCSQILVASGPLLSTFSLGMTQGFSAILLPQLNSTDNSTDITQEEASWIASMAALPMALGCILGGFLIEKTGRKMTQILTTIPCLLGWLLIAASTNTAMLLTGRFLTGSCGGLLGPSSSVYISETSEPRYRGILLGAMATCVAVGLLVVHVLGTFLHWKTVGIIASVFPVITVVLLILVPESPSWLAQNGHVEQARRAFFWCRGDTEASRKEVADIIDRENAEKHQKEPKLKKFCDGKFLKPLIIIVVFLVTNQWAGINALTFYTVSIMQKTLNKDVNNYLAMIIVDLIRVFMSICACVIMTRMRRRPLAIISGIGTSLSLFVLSGYTYLVRCDTDMSSSWYAVIPMTSLIVYICFVTVGFVPLPWAMLGEVFALNTRNMGSTVSSFMAFSAFFVVVKTNPAMFDSLGVDGTFLVYGSAAAAGTAFVAAFLPETKDKTLAEIEDNFETNDL